MPTQESKTRWEVDEVPPKTEFRMMEPQLTLRGTFLALARYTTPAGYEQLCVPFIPGEPEVDQHGNWHVLVRDEDGEVPPVMFSSHLDTADRGYPKTVRFKYTKKGKIKTDGNTILGADCKIGVALMIQMIREGVPGWYVFHAGEEVGGIGSTALAKDRNLWPCEPLQCVAFDRFGYESVITHQFGTRTASDEYALALAAELRLPGRIELGPDNGGTFTDSASYEQIIPECTNLSVGYLNQHTCQEVLNIRWAEDLLDQLLAVDWDNLPIVRDPEDPANDTWGYHWDSSKDDDGSVKAESVEPDPFELPEELPQDPDDWERVSANRLRYKPKREMLATCTECERGQMVPADELMNFCENCGTPVEPDGDPYQLMDA